MGLHSNFWGWLLQRLTGAVIFVWALMHLYTNFLLVLGPEAYEGEVELYHSLGFTELMYIILGIAIYIHVVIGLSMLLSDISARKKSNTNTSWFSSQGAGISRRVWFLRRITGFLLVFLVTYHLYRIHVVLGYEYYSDYYKVMTFGYGNTLGLLMYIVFVFSLGIHAFDGARVIINDFFGVSSQRLITIMFLLGIVYGLIGSYIAITMFLRA